MAKTSNRPTATELRPLAYGISTTVRVSGLGKSKIYEEIAAGRLKSVKVAGRRLILHDDLEAYLRSSPRPA